MAFNDDTMVEIERRFLISGRPLSLSDHPYVEISQGYLAVESNGGHVRLRRAADELTLTAKRGSGLVRAEYEVRLGLAEFRALWPATEGRRVEKSRYRIGWQGTTIELDIYRGSLTGLLTAEVEFDSVAAADAFVPPAWFGSEITVEPAYRNHSLAACGTVPKR
ncbi:CYTH domain-containing protein [Nocardia suismassiliense]|uniref:CYTH domain-containing protein n=1 Tax=Nocardia suismassiliense TaxID=2077092 RepID=UPI0018FF0048|nr:CYTH domain-containing protein [Nocardia suismassiliense]